LTDVIGAHARGDALKGMVANGIKPFVAGSMVANTEWDDPVTGIPTPTQVLTRHAVPRNIFQNSWNPFRRTT
jgi:hypothetical protein